MTSENFCYWLQGWFELNATIDHREGATPETIQAIKDHLQLVFEKKTPMFNVRPSPLFNPIASTLEFKPNQMTTC